MQKNKLIIGNWKMHKTLSTAVNDFTEFVNLISKSKTQVEIGISAPSLFLSELSRRTGNCVSLYAQNSHWENEGAFTGEISPVMLKSARISGSLVGHSERRQLFLENNAQVGKRLGALLRHGLKAVLCIGETLQQREAGLLHDVLSTQIHEAFCASGLSNSFEFVGSNPNSPLLSIAYEPVWAIGTGRAATPKEAQQAHGIIREELKRYFNAQAVEQIKILYGGSVKTNNIKDFLSTLNIDGALVGGASLIPSDFAALCQF